MLIKNVVISVFLIFSLGACTEPPPEDTGKLRVIEVTDHEFKINGESAVTVIVGHANVAEYSFSLRKSDLKKGTLLQSVSDSNPNAPRGFCLLVIQPNPDQAHERSGEMICVSRAPW